MLTASKISGVSFFDYWFDLGTQTSLSLSHRVTLLFEQYFGVICPSKYKFPCPTIFLFSNVRKNEYKFVFHIINKVEKIGRFPSSAVNDPSAYITESGTTEEHLRKDCRGLPHLLKMNFHFPMEG